MRHLKNTAQTFVEYTLLLGIIFLFFLTISPLIRRGNMGLVKLVADQVGNQKDAEQEGGKQGYIINIKSTTHVDHTRSIAETLDETRYGAGDRDEIYSEQTTNQGLSE